MEDGTYAVCCECSAPFRFDPLFYAERGLQAPRRCRFCRSARRTTDADRSRLFGTVEYFDDRGFGFVEHEGVRAYVAQQDVRVDDLPLVRGDRVSFEVQAHDPGARRHPRARVVRREE